VTTHSSRWRTGYGFLVLSLICLPLASQGAQNGKIDSKQLRAPIRSFENLIAEVVKATLPGDFGVVQDPKGAFVPDTGYNFWFMVNVNRGVINSPFGQLRGPAPSQEMKKQKLATLKEMLVQLLYSHGSSMPMLLSRDKTITIVARFEDFTPDEGTVDKTLILSVTKGDIDESLSKQLSINEFKNRVKIFEY